MLFLRLPLSFFAKFDFYELAKKWSLFWFTFLPRCSSSSTLFIFPLLFFGKLFNQFTLPWGQIPTQIKNFIILWKWEAANTFYSPHTRLNWIIKVRFGWWKTLQKQWLRQGNLWWNANIEVHILITKWIRVPRLDPCTKTTKSEGIHIILRKKILLMFFRILTENKKISNIFFYISNKN